MTAEEIKLELQGLIASINASQQIVVDKVNELNDVENQIEALDNVDKFKIRFEDYNTLSNLKSYRELLVSQIAELKKQKSGELSQDIVKMATLAGGYISKMATEDVTFTESLNGLVASLGDAAFYQEAVNAKKRELWHATRAELTALGYDDVLKPLHSELALGRPQFRLGDYAEPGIHQLIPEGDKGNWLRKFAMQNKEIISAARKAPQLPIV